MLVFNYIDLYKLIKHTNIDVSVNACVLCWLLVSSFSRVSNISYVFNFTSPAGASFRFLSSNDKYYFLYAWLSLQFSVSVEMEIDTDRTLKVANIAAVYKLQSWPVLQF